MLKFFLGRSSGTGRKDMQGLVSVCTNNRILFGTFRWNFPRNLQNKITLLTHIYIFTMLVVVLSMRYSFVASPPGLVGCAEFKFIITIWRRRRSPSEAGQQQQHSWQWKSPRSAGGSSTQSFAPALLDEDWWGDVRCCQNSLEERWEKERFAQKKRSSLFGTENTETCWGLSVSSTTGPSTQDFQRVFNSLSVFRTQLMANQKAILTPAWDCGLRCAGPPKGR